MEKLQIIATGYSDFWSRPLYKDKNDRIYADINCGNGTPDVHVINDWDEPLYRLQNYKIVTELT